MGEQTDDKLTYCILASEQAKPSPWQAGVEGSRGEEEPTKQKTNFNNGRFGHVLDHVWHSEEQQC